MSGDPDFRWPYGYLNVYEPTYAFRPPTRGYDDAEHTHQNGYQDYGKEYRFVRPIADVRLSRVLWLCGSVALVMGLTTLVAIGRRR